MQDAFARKALLYDKAGEEHFNIISALHKSIRNSDADAGLYWLARMLEAGEDPAVRRAPAGALRVGGRGHGRPAGPRGGHGRAAGRPFHRDAGRRAGPGPARRVPGRRAQEQRALRRLRRGGAGRAHHARGAGPPLDPQRPHSAHEAARLRQAATATPTTRRRAWRRWSACPKPCGTAATTGRPTAARRRRRPPGWRRRGASAGVRAGATRRPRSERGAVAALRGSR